MRSARGVALLLALAVTAVAGCSPTAPNGRTPAPGASGQRTDLTRSASATTSAPAAPVDPAAIDAAVRFIQLWGRPTIDPRTWLADVVPLATPRYGQALATVDPARVPAALPDTPPGTATSIGSTAPRALSATPDGAVVLVSITGGTVKVTVLHTSSSWLVDDVEPGTTP
ncbi:hypothetical protein [Dactylosporangium sp. CA-233914]|uniref:hypothetical protein n=1 Tax=Dactylosporangium sp. CA-233914 TaxID=3239934 RepID=UPI003D8B74B1